MLWDMKKERPIGHPIQEKQSRTNADGLVPTSTSKIVILF